MGKKSTSFRRIFFRPNLERRKIDVALMYLFNAILVIFDICGLMCMTSTMFIDNKAILFLLIMPIIQLRDCTQSNGVTNRDVTKDVTKQLKNAGKGKDGEEN